MLQVLSRYEQEGFVFTEYTEDGTTTSHVVKARIPQIEPIEPQTTIEEQVYAENLFQTALLEMQMLGGM